MKAPPVHWAIIELAARLRKNTHSPRQEGMEVEKIFSWASGQEKVFLDLQPSCLSEWYFLAYFSRLLKKAPEDVNIELRAAGFATYGRSVGRI